MSLKEFTGFGTSRSGGGVAANLEKRIQAVREMVAFLKSGGQIFFESALELVLENASVEIANQVLSVIFSSIEEGKAMIKTDEELAYRGRKGTVKGQNVGNTFRTYTEAPAGDISGSVKYKHYHDFGIARSGKTVGVLTLDGITVGIEIAA